MRGTVLVVDDRARPRRALATELEDAGFAVLEAADGREAWESFCEHAPDVVVTDVVMPRSDGIDLLSRIRTRSDVPVILFTARGSVESASTAFKAGADDFVSSPDVDVEDLVALVANAVQGRRALAEVSSLEERLIGSSRPICRLRERISGLAPLRTPVLIVGETGTGRDTAARALHDLGSTSGSEWTPIDCASFTPGRTLPAEGSIYLDNIERLSPEAQVFWADRVAAGEADGFRSGPRIFASATDPLLVSLAEGSVYQELRGVLLRFSIDLPPLRTVKDDIPAITDALVRRIGEAVGRKVRLSPSTREFLASQRWPGNVKQLGQVLERAIAFSRGRQIRREVVKEVLEDLEESLSSIRDQQTALERDALLRTIRETGGNITQTADRLGKSRAAVYRLIEKHGIPLTRRG